MSSSSATTTPSGGYLEEKQGLLANSGSINSNSNNGDNDDDPKRVGSGDGGCCSSALESLKSWKLTTWLKLIGVLLLVVALVVLIVVFNKEIFQKYLPNVLDFIKKLGIWGALIYIVIYITATVLFIPGSILTLAGGFIYGLYKGTLIVWIGATVGATLAFFIGRFLLRGWVEQKVQNYPKFRAVDAAVASRGWFIVLLFRLAPLLPFNLLNYALALTQVSSLHYFLATSVGMLPGTVMYVYFGSLAGNIAEVVGGKAGPDLKLKIVLWVVSGVIIVLVVVVVTMVARKAINKTMADLPKPLVAKNVD